MICKCLFLTIVIDDLQRLRSLRRQTCPNDASQGGCIRGRSLDKLVKRLALGLGRCVTAQLFPRGIDVDNAKGMCGVRHHEGVR